MGEGLEGLVDAKTRRSLEIATRVARTPTSRVIEKGNYRFRLRRRDIYRKYHLVYRNFQLSQRAHVFQNAIPPLSTFFRGSLSTSKKSGKQRIEGNGRLRIIAGK